MARFSLFHNKILPRWYLTPILLKEWKTSTFKRMNERPIEYGFAFKCLMEKHTTEVLDVGSGETAWPNIMTTCGFRVTAIDKKEGYWTGAFFNRHYYILTDDVTEPKIEKQFDFITCISVLEHIPNHRAAIKGMFSLLKTGGHLVLTFPYHEEKYVNDVYRLPGAGYGQEFPYICQIFSRKEIEAWMKENPSRILVQEYYQVFSGDLWTFGDRVYPPQKVTNQERHHLTCILLQKA